MKNRSLRLRQISCCILLLYLFSCCFAFGEQAGTEDLSDFQRFLQENRKYRTDPKSQWDASDLFYAARNAEGDPLVNFAEAQRYAAELGIARSFAISTENAIAADNGSTDRIMAGYDDYWLTDSKEPAFTGNLLKGEVKLALASEEARAIVPPSLWTDQRFRDVYGVSLKDFRPSRPRSGILLLALSPSACGWPDMPALDNEEAMGYSIGNAAKMMTTLQYAFDRTHSVLQVTGNPDTASVIVEMDVQFDFYAEYGNNYHGYDMVVKLTAYDAKSRKKISDFSVKGSLGYRVMLEDDNHTGDYVWSDFPSWPREPPDKNTANFDRFLNAIERHAAKPVQTDNTTPEPFGALPVLLEEESAKTRDPWLKAVLSSGAENFRIQDGKLSFTLCSFNPRPDTLDDKADDPVAFLQLAGQNALSHDLTVTVALQDGFIGKKTRQDILAAVKRAAEDSKKAFGSKVMTEMLRAVYFPAPSGKFKNAEELAEAAAAMPESAFHYPYKNPTAATIRFYKVQKCAVNVSGGPDQLELSVTGLSRSPQVIPLSLEDLAGSGFSRDYENMLWEILD